MDGASAFKSEMDKKYALGRQASNTSPIPESNREQHEERERQSPAVTFDVPPPSASSGGSIGKNSAKKSFMNNLRSAMSGENELQTFESSSNLSEDSIPNRMKRAATHIGGSRRPPLPSFSPNGNGGSGSGGIAASLPSKSSFNQLTANNPSSDQQPTPSVSATTSPATNASSNSSKIPSSIFGSLKKKDEISIPKYKIGPRLPQVPNTDQPRIGILKVQVISAENLLAADTGGTSDPYCIVYTDQQRLQTSVKPKTLNPVWNETFELDIFKSTTQITFLLYDQDHIKPDDFLGTVSISLSELNASESEGATITEVLVLEPSESKEPAQGSITVAFTYKELLRQSEIDEAHRKLLNDLLPQSQQDSSQDADALLVKEQLPEIPSPIPVDQNQKDQNSTHQQKPEPPENPDEITTTKSNLNLILNSELIQKLTSQIEAMQTQLKKSQDDLTLLKLQLSIETEGRKTLERELFKVKGDLADEKELFKTTVDELLDEKLDPITDELKETKGQLENIRDMHFRATLAVEDLDRTLLNQNEMNRDFERKISELDTHVRAIQQKQVSKMMQWVFYMIALIIQVPGISKFIMKMTTLFAQAANAVHRVKGGSSSSTTASAAAQSTAPTPASNSAAALAPPGSPNGPAGEIPQIVPQSPGVDQLPLPLNSSGSGGGGNAEISPKPSSSRLRSVSSSSDGFGLLSADNAKSENLTLPAPILTGTSISPERERSLSAASLPINESSPVSAGRQTPKSNQSLFLEPMDSFSQDSEFGGFGGSITPALSLSPPPSTTRLHADFSPKQEREANSMRKLLAKKKQQTAPSPSMTGSIPTMDFVNLPANGVRNRKEGYASWGPSSSKSFGSKKADLW